MSDTHSNPATEVGGPAIPAREDIPFVPTNADLDIVFNNPWEAKAFALVVQLYQQGHFTWPEWAAALSEEIKGAADDDGSGYYLMWLAAAEKLIEEKTLCQQRELDERKRALEDAQGGPAPTSAPA